MINFKKLQYERVDFEDTKNNINDLLLNLKKQNEYKAYLEIIKKIIYIQNHVEEMFDYVDIRNMRDVNDEYWASEIAYWNSIKDKLDLLFIPFYKELTNDEKGPQLSLKRGKRK